MSEDGKAQDILAVYLVKGHDVTRHESPAALATVQTVAPPVTKRHFILIFHLFDYTPDLDKAMDYFFGHVLHEGDTLQMAVPNKVVRVRIPASGPDAMRSIRDKVTTLLKKELALAGREYNQILKDLMMDIKDTAGISEFKLTDRSGEAVSNRMSQHINSYNLDIERLEQFQNLDLGKLNKFADAVKKLDGSKHVFLFFQREMVPQFNSKALYQLLFQDAGQGETMRIFDITSGLPKRFFIIDPVSIKKAFSDASVDVHFLYLTTNRQDIGADAEIQSASPFQKMQEVTSDVYKAFRDIAEATGGTVDSSLNAVAMLKTAAEASENYYVLYYSPKDYKADGKFHEIKVRVKGKSYQVTNRAGYIAD